MADTTKLAGTFKAVRIVFAVELGLFDIVLNRCKELGLSPSLRDFQDWPNGRRFLLQVTMPAISEGAFLEELKSLHAPVVHGSYMDLICPPPTEVPVA